MDGFWADSVHRGILARSLAHRIGRVDPEAMFLNGLLSDIGHLLLYIQMPEAMTAVLQCVRSTGEEISSVERVIIGWDYADVGAELIKAWGLPSSIELPIRHQSEPENTPEFALETWLLHIASALITAPKSAHADDAAALRIAPCAWQCTGLSPDCMDEVRSEADAQLNSIISVFY